MPGFTGQHTAVPEIVLGSEWKLALLVPDSGQRLIRHCFPRDFLQQVIEFLFVFLVNLSP